MTVNEGPVNLGAALGTLRDVYTPRVVARMNDCDVKVAHVAGEGPWHVHNDTDQCFLVLEGRYDVGLSSHAGSIATVTLEAGDVYVVPKGIVHKPSSSGGATLEINRSHAAPRSTTAGRSRAGPSPPYQAIR